MSDIKVYGEHEPKTLAQMQRCMSVGSAVKGVLCADGHLGYAHPIGGVVAYEEDISISGVGFDIACGNMAVRLDARYTDIAPRAKSILDDIGRSISFGVGQRNAVKVDHDLFDSPLWDAAGVANLKEMARNPRADRCGPAPRFRARHDRRGPTSWDERSPPPERAGRLYWRSP